MIAVFSYICYLVVRTFYSYLAHMPKLIENISVPFEEKYVLGYAES